MAHERAIHSVAGMSNSITYKRSGILLAGVPGVPPGNVVFLGAGWANFMTNDVTD